ncbi:DUF4199 domain-containing protein [Aquimarina sp. AU474]|uniref:DUF4199 domain-containing protein n=1 Tax=Aquimarina sp. AU474 TaxID=2108529 RepID=UPI001357B35D|nr:DUF4199 domain-containing protein [Aquimarina sp. AU474]
MKKPVSIKKHVIKYGLILGILITTKIIFMTYTTFPIRFILGLSELFFLGSTIFYGIYKYKRSTHGILTLKQVLYITLGISFIGGLFTVLWFALKYNIIEPDYLNRAVEREKERLLQENFDITYEEVEQLTKHTYLYASSYAQAGIYIFQNLIFGPIFGLIAYVFLYKRQKL